MDTKDLKGLMEAYSEVYAPEQLEEMEVKLKTPEERAKYIEDAKKREERKKQPSIFDIARKRKEEGRPLKINLSRAVAAQNKKEAEKRAALKKEELDIFDVVLEFLQVEGFAETLEEAEWLMANVIDEEAIDIILGEEQLDEISQKTATSAYAASKTGEFEGADSDRDIKRSDNLRRHIKRKFGAGAAKHADRAADSMTFGRKDKSGRSKQSPKPRIEKSDYRTTQDGKMHKQDQKELKTNLRIKRDRRLRAKES